MSTESSELPVRLVIAKTGAIDVDELVADQCWINDVMGIEEREQALLATFERADDASRARAFIRQLFSERGIASEIRTEEVSDEGWLDAWRPHAQVIETGRFVIQPPWLAARDTQAGLGDRLQIVVDPGHAFGSGSHASTRLALRAIEMAVAELPEPGGSRLLDVGCGSGVLSIAGLHLGIGTAIAIDIDPAAITATDANAERNGVAERVRVSASALSDLDETFDLIAANVLATILRDLGADLAARLSDRGRLVISGMLIDQVDGVVDCLPGLSVEDRLVEDGWAAAVLKRVVEPPPFRSRGRSLRESD